MSSSTVFNITVCIIGILIFFVHIVNLLVKKNKRKDERWLLYFITFTALHFATYLTYSSIKNYYTSDSFVKTFYTIFYIFNNLEALFFFGYTMSYIQMSQKAKKKLQLFNIILLSIFIILDIVNIFTGIFFYAENGEYIRSKTMIISQGYQFVLFFVVFIMATFNKKLSIREKLSFVLYCIIPLIAIIIQNIYKGYAIAYVSIIVAIEILFFFANVERNIILAKQEEENKEAQVKIMISQIQPHFIYNSLSAISTLITIDPERAQESLDKFTEYLRRNLSSLTETKMIPFKDELKHIETYVALEKLRFNKRLNIIYDLGTTDFTIPPLTIQPLVENAIKHGILKKLEGGTVTLTTYESEDHYVIEVKDDGVGFDISQINFDENVHFGLKNISYRISQMCDGNLNIASKIGVGTRITVTFKK